MESHSPTTGTRKSQNRPREWRKSKGLAEDPLAAFRESGYVANAERERGEGVADRVVRGRALVGRERDLVAGPCIVMPGPFQRFAERRSELAGNGNG